MADSGRFVGTEEEVVAFLTLIMKKQVTAIRGEMCSRGFDKPWTALRNK